MFILLFYIDFNFKIYVYNFYCLSSKEITQKKKKKKKDREKISLTQVPPPLF